MPLGGLFADTTIPFSQRGLPIKFGLVRDPNAPPDINEQLEEARQRAREEARSRRGRRASILTSGRGITEPLGTTIRPRAAALLGGN